MEVRQYAMVAWRWAWLICVATALAAGVSYCTSSRLPRTYRTSTTLLIGQFLQSKNPSATDFATSEQLAQSYAQLAVREPLLQATIDALGWDISWETLAGQVSATTLPQTQLMQINVADTDPQRAKVIADELAHQVILQSPTLRDQQQDSRQQFVNDQLTSLQARLEDGNAQIQHLEEALARETSAAAIRDIQNQIAAQQQKVTTWQTSYTGLLNYTENIRTNNISVVESATVPTRPVGPNVLVNVLVAGATGLVLALGAALLLEYFDQRMKTREQVEQSLQLPTIGTVSAIPRVLRAQDQLITVRDTGSPISESYRLLRANLFQSGLGDVAHGLFVTSPGPGEGKTTTACNLAVAMARTGKRVILCDADMRRPSLHRVFGITSETGLSNLLEDDSISLSDVGVETAIPNLWVVPAGPLPRMPGELLGSEQMAIRFREMKRLVDVVILDTPAALSVADALVVGAFCNPAVLVVDANRTTIEAAIRCKQMLEQANVSVMGVVLNRAEPSRKVFIDDEYYSVEA